MPQRFRFSSGDDILLLQQVRQEVPFTSPSHSSHVGLIGGSGSGGGETDRGWQRIASNLRERGLQVETRTVKDRFYLLFRKYLDDDVSGLKRGATDADFQQKEQLLQQISVIMRQVDGGIEARIRRKSIEASMSPSLPSVAPFTSASASLSLHDEDSVDDSSRSNQSEGIAENNAKTSGYHSHGACGSLPESNPSSIPHPRGLTTDDLSKNTSVVEREPVLRIAMAGGIAPYHPLTLPLSLIPMGPMCVDQREGASMSDHAMNVSNGQNHKRQKLSKDPLMTQEGILAVLQSLERHKAEEVALRERELLHAQAKLEMEREYLELSKAREAREVEGGAARDEQMKLQLSLLYELLERTKTGVHCSHSHCHTLSHSPSLGELRDFSS